MKSIYIVGIIILLGETECFIEDTTSIKILEEQRTLLRKLQNFQDPNHEKPLTWNEILADVLVNKIRIFSFNEINENEIKEDYDRNMETSSILTVCFSQVMLFYKKCIYDPFMRKVVEPDPSDSSTTEEVYTVMISPGELDPEGDVELIEPKYHGKKRDVEGNEEVDAIKAGCPDGAEKNQFGNCVNSRLLISVPSQCPRGYRLDRLGNCRVVFF
ncbi:unnamed protein product [Chrysodeixis includens]|uniref:Uncharacterized protein n=1 Tax=Chrysodeixis includens TaxID=689277 RepID=A0A9P0BR00_CHRIL|nr:unnamed protein product [Chrysodeixis includens]